MGIVCQLGDIDGPSVHVGLEFLQADGTSLARLDAEQAASGGLALVQLSFVLPVNGEGSYELKLFSGERQLHQQSIHVRRIVARGPADKTH